MVEKDSYTHTHTHKVRPEQQHFQVANTNYQLLITQTMVNLLEVNEEGTSKTKCTACCLPVQVESMQCSQVVICISTMQDRVMATRAMPVGQCTASQGKYMLAHIQAALSLQVT